MREVAKSMLGFSWAVSLFSMQQIAKLVTPSSQPAELTALQIEEASRAVQSYLSDTVAAQFRTGDAWQRRIVDTLFDMASLDPRVVVQNFDPRQFTDAVDARQVVQSSVDFAQRSIDTLRQTVTPSPATRVTVN